MVSLKGCIKMNLSIHLSLCTYIVGNQCFFVIISVVLIRFRWNLVHALPRPNLGWLQISASQLFNTLRPRQNGRRFAADTFKRIFLNENVLIPVKISLKFVPKGPINNTPALVRIMAWRRPGDKLLSEPMMVSLPTHMCVTRPQWVKYVHKWFAGTSSQCRHSTFPCP